MRIPGRWPPDSIPGLSRACNPARLAFFCTYPRKTLYLLHYKLMSMNIDLIPHLIRHHNPENLPASFQMFPDGTARIVVFPEPAKPGTVLATWDRFTKLEKAMAEVDALPWGPGMEQEQQ